MAKQRGTGSGYNYKRDPEHAQEGTSHVVQQSRQQSNAMVVAHLFISAATTGSLGHVDAPSTSTTAWAETGEFLPLLSPSVQLASTDRSAMLATGRAPGCPF